MQPLKIIALLTGGLPLAAFLATLFLTDGAPLKSLAPGEESGPVAVTRALPPAALERPTLEPESVPIYDPIWPPGAGFARGSLGATPLKSAHSGPFIGYSRAY
jgi:hypothetical protein